MINAVFYILLHQGEQRGIGIVHILLHDESCSKVLFLIFKEYGITPLPFIFFYLLKDLHVTLFSWNMQIYTVEIKIPVIARRINTFNSNSSYTGGLVVAVTITADVTNDSDYPKLSHYCYIDYEMGQIVKGRYGVGGSATQYSHLWVKNVYGRLGLNYEPFDWLDIRCGFELRVYFTTFPTEKQTDFTSGLSKYYSIYPHEAQGIFRFLDNESVFMDLAIGYFPYRYNPEVRNLGEYLFRSGTYPVYLINDYDFPLARLAGLRYSLGFTNDLLGIGLDLLILSETQMRPFHDITLAPILDFNIIKDEGSKRGVINIGAGLSFAHFFSIDDSLTTPRNNKTLYFDNINGYDIDTTNGDTLWDADSAYYTFKGTKIMLRATVDPFAFLRNKEGFLGDFFGLHGGKLYGELGIIGLQNYPDNKHISPNAPSNPYGYANLNEKMPMMFGVTLPCWKILDICAFELELFDCPYPNDYEKVQQYGYPLPADKPDTLDEYNSRTYRNDKIKWSVFLKKNITEHFGMILQFCRDHERWEWGAAGFKHRFPQLLKRHRFTHPPEQKLA